MKKLFITLIVFLMMISLPALSSASLMLTFSDPNGLGATADFSLSPDGYDLGIVLTNTSTAIPSGFSNSDALLTSISFDLGSYSIIGGIAFTNEGAPDFNDVIYALPPPSTGPGGESNVSPEWGYGNTGTTGLLNNFVSTNQSHATKFAPGNLDGPDPLSGPQGGLSNDIYESEFGGSNPLGRINNSVTFWLNLDMELTDLSFLQNGAIVEFGSDAAFLHPIPEPATMLLLGSGLIGFAVVGRKKFFKKS